MCYDISQYTDAKKLTEYFQEPIDTSPIQLEIFAPEHFQAQVFPDIPVILWNSEMLQVKLFTWGLIAQYMNSAEKIKKQRSWMCNARAEKILEKSSYWSRILTQRCLIPVQGIYEHRTVKGFKNKIPYHISCKGREMFCLPGLYNYSPLPDIETGEMVGTFTIITTAANPLMQQIHNGGENKFRMPLFLPKELERKWLEPDVSAAQISNILQHQFAPDDLAFHTVATIRSAKWRADGKLKHEPFLWPNLPDLGDEGFGETLSLF